MALGSSCNLLSNPSFETGTLQPWITSAVNMAKVSNGTQAYSGDYYLDLETAVGNRGITISQVVKNLDPRLDYTFTMHVQSSALAANYCSFYAYAGLNATTGFIASDTLYDSGEWTLVTGQYRPKLSREFLNIIASCTFEDSSNTGHVFIDDVTLSASDGCPSAE
ncbi:carbohydrate binding domain protein [Aspergillus clavatus NRRL 1]|uniref:Carbohydrate binding domain protein n=1 Tax=Aspergillus clavatus (strain ATCC 1007 / CBS 513.65 / DSM 816 / NCTC 3887 / NRRL 1 / QM 1276 / 107) TaxID=344612 RepID=A1CLM7_ASPCL|nr:carbohydrate binding domain protein [Aspergillus clavatus NRRL 1]EAW09006.1 carbohydrate binding domain protein [Aspergillus clavatus NRRL 1]